MREVNRKDKRFLVCLGLAVLFVLIYGQPGEAHWWGTQKMMIDQAIPILKNEIEV